MLQQQLCTRILLRFYGDDIFLYTFFHFLGMKGGKKTIIEPHRHEGK